MKKKKGEGENGRVDPLPEGGHVQTPLIRGRGRGVRPVPLAKREDRTITEKPEQKKGGCPVGPTRGGR